LSWNHDDNGDSSGNDDNHNKGNERNHNDSNDNGNNNKDSSRNGIGRGEREGDDKASYSGHESMSEKGLHNEDDISEVTTKETFFEITIGGPDCTAKLPGKPQEILAGEARERYLQRA
jgi:hypothetical protein